MALKELYQAFTGQTDFLYKCAGACLMASRDIQNEDPGTENHSNRILWASQVDMNPKAMARLMLRDILKNATVAADVENATDNDIQYVVNSYINTYATGA